MSLGGTKALRLSLHRTAGLLCLSKSHGLHGSPTVSGDSAGIKCVRSLHSVVYRSAFLGANRESNVNRAVKMSTGSATSLLFRQLLDYKSYTYTYLLADPQTRAAILIDPVIEMVDRDVALIRDLGLDLKYAVNTHVHADHVTGTGELKKRLSGCRSLISAVSQAKADQLISEGDVIRFGSYHLDCRSTPGHTDGCMSFVLQSEGLVFTGDAVLIRGCGRTDFQQGDAGRLYDSVHEKILSLPSHFKIYPAHDYTGQTCSTVGEELMHNQRLTRTRDEFIKIMKTLNLPYPKQIDKALPANMVCGVFDTAES